MILRAKDIIIRARLMNFADYRLQRTLGPARFHAHQCVGPIAAGAASFSQLKRALGQTPSLYSTGDLVGSQPPIILALRGGQSPYSMPN